MEANILQNAMNAAEITDKLGLHSLRQRAWVSLYPFARSIQHAYVVSSTSNPLAPLLVMVFMKVWSGSATPSARLDTTKRIPFIIFAASRLLLHTTILQPRKILQKYIKIHNSFPSTNPGVLFRFHEFPPPSCVSGSQSI